MLRTSWETVCKILPPDVYHGAINVLVNGDGRRANVPVALHLMDKKILEAEVTFFHSPNFLYQAALGLVLKKLNDNKLIVEWDGVSFHSPTTTARSNLHPNDRFAETVIDASTRDLIDTFKIISARWQKENPTLDRTNMREIDKQRFDEFCAAIVGNSAIVKSNDIERMIHLQAGKAAQDFKPQGLEL